MIIRKTDRVLIQGITGKQGSFWCEHMQNYGTQVVAGVNPRKPGITHCNVSVYGSAKDAMRETGFDVSVLFVPPLLLKDAALDAIEAGARSIIALSEHVPVHDVMFFLDAARANNCKILGPNTAGCVTPGEAFAGFMPAFNKKIFQPGSIGIISRSGSLGTLVCLNVTQAGFGQSAFIGIGGDPIIGTTQHNALQALDNFRDTQAIVMVGEIGGSMEEKAAEYAATMDKPLIAFIAGGAAPAGKKMGHAGAIVSGSSGSYVSKAAALQAAGANVVATPSHIGDALKEVVSPQKG
ncbi:MAG: succinyl-CoA synthetase subunit alpha [Pseudomonadota bacterium]